MNALFFAFLAQAATFTAPTSAPLLGAESAAVVRGVVVSVDARPCSVGLETEYVIAVEETLAGRHAPELTVVLPGGRLDGLVQQFSGVPLWDAGDEVVVMVPSEGPVRIRGLWTVEAGALVGATPADGLSNLLAAR